MQEDSKIIELFFARDESAITELSDKYGGACLSVALNILRNRPDAEECVNDAYLAVWNVIPPKKPNPLKTFLLRLVRNISINKYHANTAAKRNSYYDAALEELADCIASPETVDNHIQAEELSALLDRFLGTLSKDSRIMFMCRYWCSDSVSDIADKFGTSSHNVSARLDRVRKKLRKYLRKEGFEV